VDPSLKVPVAVKVTPLPLFCAGVNGERLIETSAACDGPLLPVKVQVPDALDCASAGTATNKSESRSFMLSESELQPGRNLRRVDTDM
jgi:hypothetical protein